MKKFKVAIFGSTWHIAKWIIDCLWNSHSCELFLFSRKPAEVVKFLKEKNIEWLSMRYEDFDSMSYDIIINCIWIWTPNNLSTSFYDQMIITEYYDQMILKYVFNNAHVKYINLSSWAVYNSDFTVPASEEFCSNIHVNQLKKSDCYGISKLNTECKHRVLDGFFIVDIRVFSYFSRYIDLNAWFLLSDIIKAIKTGSVLPTSNDEIFRDYISHFELSELIMSLINSKENINSSIDMKSSEPISNTQLLLFCKENFWLQYCISQRKINSITWIKKYYYSNYISSNRIWYIPSKSSLEIISQEMIALLEH